MDKFVSIANCVLFSEMSLRKRSIQDVYDIKTSSDDSDSVNKISSKSFYGSRKKKYVDPFQRSLQQGVGLFSDVEATTPLKARRNSKSNNINLLHQNRRNRNSVTSHLDRESSSPIEDAAKKFFKHVSPGKKLQISRLNNTPKREKRALFLNGKAVSEMDMNANKQKRNQFNTCRDSCFMANSQSPVEQRCKPTESIDSAKVNGDLNGLEDMCADRRLSMSSTISENWSNTANDSGSINLISEHEFGEDYSGRSTPTISQQTQRNRDIAASDELGAPDELIGHTAENSGPCASSSSSPSSGTVVVLVFTVLLKYTFLFNIRFMTEKASHSMRSAGFYRARNFETMAP